MPFVPYDDLTGTIVKKICMACSREFAGTLANCPHDGNMLQALPQDQWEGKRLADRYKIDRRLGTGGMGVVYLAWHELMERWVAIKMLKQSFIEDEQSVKRFQQEAKAASRLKHPNVITLYEFGVAPTGQPYMVMDYLVGTNADKQLQARSLAQEIRGLNQVPVERCIHILAQACDALEHAHRQGVIHRDVKPANIMIVPGEDDPDFVKVVDFGVAKLLPINNGAMEVQGLTQMGEVCGSPVYMSPEQCMGQALDPRADIYSMGVVLYEAATGRLPLVGKNMVDTMQKHMNEPVPAFKAVRPDLFLPEKFEEVVMRALSKQPHARQQNMSELAQDLRFSIPRAGQTPNLKTHEILPLETAPERKELPNWFVPTATALGIITLIICTAIFAFGPHSAKPPQSAVPPASTGTRMPPPGAVVPPPPVQPSTAVAPTTAPPMTVTPTAVPPASVPATTTQTAVAPTTATPTSVAPPTQRPAAGAPHHTAVSLSPKHHTPSTHQSATPAPAAHGDPFKDLMKSKSYKQAE
jgi:serine/threonine-protein kinase